MKNNPFFKLILFSILLFIIHQLVSTYVIPSYQVEGIYKMHLFLAIITITIIFLIQRVTKVDPENFGKGFMVAVVLKMLMTIGFLWPIISTPSTTQKAYVAHFFTVFFIYLLAEVKLLISGLRK